MKNRIVIATSKIALRYRETVYSFMMIRCGKHMNRPSQADNLHVDIWYDGVNILRDAGSYRYNVDQKLTNFFTGTISHNTLMVNEIRRPIE